MHADPETAKAEAEVAERTDVAELLADTPQDANLVNLLLAVQARIRYLPVHALRAVAGHLGLAEANVYGVATFYNRFRFTPPGRHHVQVCLGTACHVKGGGIVLESWERNLGISEGEVTEDREVSLERVACVGCCTLAPVCLVDEVVEAKVAPTRVDGLTMRFKMEREKRDREAAAADEAGGGDDEHVAG